MSDRVLILVGTYTTRLPHVEGKSEGIYAYWLDLASGALEHASTRAGIVNPSYLATDPQQRYVYATSEVDESGAVSAFRLNRVVGDMTPLNYQSSGGKGPCHVWVDATGQWALVANYGSGSIAVYPVLEDGSLDAAADFVQHEGSSVNPNRQEGPHAHCIMTDPANEHVLVADLGMDKLLVYRLNPETGKLALSSFAEVEAGSGPRHFDFHPSGRFCFLINELASTITVFGYENGILEKRQTISTLPDEFKETNYTAAIHVSPDGRFVYGSNRGHDSIAIFAFDERAGALTAAGHESTQGRTPRDFMVDPTGTYLLAANQDTDTVVSYRIDSGTGQLTPTGHTVRIPTPVCLKPV